MKRSYIEFDLLLCVSVLFWSILLIPSIYSIMGGKTIYPNPEGRPLRSLPRLSGTVLDYVKLPNRMQEYYNDHFGLRDIMLRWRHYAMVNILNTTPLNNVVIGKDGWLYFTDQKYQYDVFLGLCPPKLNDLLKIESVLSEHYARLLKRNIKFYVAIVPDKETIYPEYLPGLAARLDTKKQMCEFLAGINLDPGIKLVNLLDPILTLKSNYLVYYQTDTHWNFYGAYAATSAILIQMAQDFPSLLPQPLTKYHLINEPKLGDIAYILNLPEKDDVRVSCKVPKLRKEMIADKVYNIVTENRSAPVLLFVHDSFGDDMVGFLAEHFSKIVMISKLVDYRPYIESVNPDVFLLESSERYVFER